MSWLLRLWPWHEHLYSLTVGIEQEDFHCRCGKTISGEELFRPDTMLGKYWRDRHPEVSK